MFLKIPPKVLAHHSALYTAVYVGNVNSFTNIILHITTPWYASE